MGLETYPNYKESGIQWMESVPQGWDVVRLKHVAHAFPSNVDKHSREGEIPVLLCNYTDVYYNDYVDSDIGFMEATATVDEIRKFTLRKGDILITKDSETADDIGRSAYVVKSLPGVLCGYHLSVIRPSARLDGRFTKRLFDSIYVKAVMEVSANGLTRVGLGQYAIDNIQIPLPPLSEQIQIANYLDSEIGKIDLIIGRQNLKNDRASSGKSGALVGLLLEYRAALITATVTGRIRVR